MPLFQQLFDKESSTYTYLIADNNEAILIDPVLEQVDRDLQLVKELGVTLKYAMNTHCHADHITGSGLIKKQLPDVKYLVLIRSVIAKASGAKADIYLEPNQIIKVGSLDIHCFDTPGHTNGCMSFYVPQLQCVFTGDTLLIHGCGRTDFQQGNSGLLYDNIHTKLFTLPEETKVYPGHDYKGFTSSTIGQEKKFNPRLTKTREEFVELMNNLGLPYPKKIDVALPANLVCGV